MAIAAIKVPSKIICRCQRYEICFVEDIGFYELAVPTYSVVEPFVLARGRQNHGLFSGVTIVESAEDFEATIASRETGENA